MEQAIETVIDTRRGSVVRQSYKAKYFERAQTARGRKGVDRKVLRDGCCDWLDLELKLHTRPKGKLDVEALEAIFDANGVKHDHFKREGNGWQGRLRMSGSKALRHVVATNGFMKLDDGSEIKAPKAWCAANTK